VTDRVRTRTYVEMRLYRAGGDADAQLRAFRKAAPGASVQTLDPAAVGGRTHLLLALKQTAELKASSQLLADRAEVDFLLRVAGTKQISQAVKEAGSKPHVDSLLVLFGGRAAVGGGLTGISKLVKLKPFSGKEPGRKAAARVTTEERDSVIEGGDVVARLLAEKAALLRK
jgi:tRNA threonylcarbamoyladenosine modification (KEOPS) complex Cgi121 subunit